MSAQLLSASVQGALLIALVWAVCRFVPRIPASVRSGLWWIASLKLLLGLLPIPALSLPTLVEREALRQTPIVRSVEQPISALVSKASDLVAPPQRVVRTDPVRVGKTAQRSRGTSQAAHESRPAVPWRGLLLSVWLVGALAGLLQLRLNLARQRRLVRNAVEWDDVAAQSLLRSLSDAMGLRVRPRLLVSSAAETPQVSGLRAPAVIVPERLLNEFSSSERAMTLCHELVHLRRNDLWLGLVPALAERIFWFHPLARLATREYALAREAACDAEVLCLLEEAPQDYGRMLVRFGTTARVSGLATAGVAPSTQTLRRRLLMLQHAGSPSPRRLAWAAVVAIAFLGLVPFRFQDQPRAGLRVEPGPPEVLRDDRSEEPTVYYEVSPEYSEDDAAADAHDTVDSYDASDAYDASESYDAWKPYDASEQPCEDQVDAEDAVIVPNSDGGGATIIMPDGSCYVIGGSDSNGDLTVVTPAPSPVAAPRAMWGPGTPAPAYAPIPPSQIMSADKFRQLQEQLERLTQDRTVHRLSERESRSMARALERLSRIDAAGRLDDLGQVDAGLLGQFDADSYSSFTWSGDGDDDRKYVLVKGDSVAYMHGSTTDLRRARRLLRRADLDRLLYFTEDDREYVIEEPDFLSDVCELFENETTSSRAQIELGARQAELGAEQAELGRRQAQLGLQQAELGVEMAQANAEMARRQMSRRSTSDLERRIEELSSEMNRLGEEQGELGEQQGELGERQAKLGEEQARVGEQQARDSERMDEMLWEKVERARRDGLARELD